MLSHEVLTEALRFLSCTLLCYAILTTLISLLVLSLKSLFSGEVTEQTEFICFLA